MQSKVKTNVKKKAMKKIQAKQSVKMKKVQTKPSAKKTAAKKIRLGIIVGKNFDPVKKGAQGPNYPKRYMFTKNEWGKYSVDVCTALRMKDLHPDLLAIDIIPGAEISERRLKSNHVNLNFWYDIGVAMISDVKNKNQHVAEVEKCHRNADCRLAPSWDYYDWVVCKPRYMEQCQKAGIPMIPTVLYKKGFNPKQCMKDVQRQGWEAFLVKLGSFSFFGHGAIHGKTSDFMGQRAKDLDKYAETNRKSKFFLLQPYMLKPNGEVFDEVRNFFIDGEWRYSVFTHGTDESDDGYYPEPDGPRKVACKELAERVYAEVLKASTWQGKRQVPLLNRIDIAIVPKKGGDSLHKTDNVYFLNEIELIMTTWLDRYAPLSVPDAMAQASVKHTLELLVGLVNSHANIPDKEMVVACIDILNRRIGPFKHINVKA